MILWSRFFLAVVVLALAACEGKEPVYQEQGYVFGTLVEVSVYGEEEPKARQAVATVMHEFQRLHDLLHAWQPSELSELNAAFARGESLAVSAELAAILEDAIRLSAQSDHLFNPAIGGLIGLWGFQSDDASNAAPDEKQVAQWVQSNPRMEDITIRHGRAESINRAVRLDLGGYAKGYALDRAAERLREQGIRNALINIGGNVMALGKHGERPWQVGIQHPRKPGTLATLALRDGEAIGTSGDYQRYFTVGNVRYCHLINPGSGYPMQGVQAVTILTRGPQAGVLSDVATKPMFISGASGWRKAAGQMKISEAMLVDAQGVIHLTGEMQKRLEFTEKHLRIEVEP